MLPAAQKILSPLPPGILTIFLAYFCTGSFCFLKAQPTEPGNNRRIIHYGVEDGLSQGSVYSMLKDSRGFLWFTSYEGLNRFDGHHFKVYYPELDDSTSLRGNMTVGLVEDPFGNIWIGSETCLNRYLRKQDAFDFVYALDESDVPTPSIHYPFYADSTEVWYGNEREGIIAYNYHTHEKRLISSYFKYRWSSSVINSVRRGADGRIWIRDTEGLVSLNPADGRTHFYFSSRPDNLLGPPSAFICHLPLNDGSLWLGAKGGIVHFDPTWATWKFYAIDPLAHIADIQQGPESSLYLGTENTGLLLFQPETGITERITPENTGLSSRSTASIYLDDEEVLWINTDPEGIDVLFPPRNGFQRYGRRFFEKNNFVSAGVRCFTADEEQLIWIGSQQDGIFVFDPIQNEIVRQFRPNGAHGFRDNHASFIHIDRKGWIWAGTYNGLYLSTDRLSFRLVENDFPPLVNHPAHECWDMVETPEGYLFFTTSGGLFFIEPGSQRAAPIETTEGLALGDLQQSGEFLLATEYDHGFIAFHYQHWLDGRGIESYISRPLDHYNVKHLFPGAKGVLWLATTSGLFKTLPAPNFQSLNILERYDKADGLPSNYIYGILKDQMETLWLSTNRGLASLDPDSRQIKAFGPEDNIQGYEFNTNAYFADPRGQLYFGGTNGFNRFYPPLDPNPAKPAIQITELKVNGKVYTEAPYIGERDFIKLPYDRNTFTVRFAAIDYWSSGDNRYQVQLEGYDERWLQLNQGEIRYTRVPPGFYTFKILADNGDGQWMQEPKTLSIQIMKPWHATTGAFVAYAVIALLLGWYGRLLRQRRARLRRQLEKEKSEAARIKELEAFKRRLYTNISHDFRTPLTVIMGVAQRLLRPGGPSTPEVVSRIHQSAGHLLQLIDQILDISKLESGQLHPEPVQTDIIGLLKQWIEDHQLPAKDKSIHLYLQTDLEVFMMDVDIRLLRHIIGNLLENALKFTPRGGRVEVAATVQQHDALTVTITDTGMGIPYAEQSSIFERFYRRGPSAGSGLGLSFVQELANTLKIALTVESQEGKGSAFCLTLPVSRQALLVKPVDPKKMVGRAIYHPETVPARDESAAGAIILLIDDHPTLVEYVSGLLKPRYQVVVAGGKQEALDIVDRQSIDLVISDVMLNTEDEGFQLCRQLKQDPQTAHLPVLLLTARSEQKSRLQGLKNGADAYLVKPFAEEELLTRIDHLLRLYKTIQKKSREISIPSFPLKDNLSFADQQQLRVLIQGILQRLSDRSFGVIDMAELVGMSTTNFNEWLQGQTGCTPARFLRRIRVEMAHELLLHTNETIESIAGRTGFSDGSHLTKKYKERYGNTPKQARKAAKS